MKRFIVLSLFFPISLISIAQRPIESSADILQEIKKLNVLTNVLYIAAHPDDENTRLIAWLENEKLARTAYLSLTRGDGGQNLVGTEKGDAMGVLRTQELLEARKIDGAEQFFSRAVDFGYSKTAEETFEKWNKDKILADVVWTIRKFKPDVIITRFPSDSRGGHGHHTASAMLAEEAFKLSSDAAVYPKQLKRRYQDYEGLSAQPFKDCYVCEPWQAKRILWNTSIWWDRQLPEKAAKTEDYIKINIGDYNKLLGLSYSEIASDSRSQHKSQGFGSSRTRGNRLEYLKHTDGEQAKSDLFEGINTTWSKVDGSAAIQGKLNQILAQYDVSQPEKSVKGLVELYQLMFAKKDNFYVKQKLEDLKRIIQAAAGIYVEVLADDYNYPSFQLTEVKGKFTLISRTNVTVSLLGIHPKVDSSFKKITLTSNEELSLPFSHEIAINPSHPYWLEEPFEEEEVKLAKIQIDHDESFTGELAEKTERWLGDDEFTSDDFITTYVKQYGMPENLSKVTFRYQLEIEGVNIFFNENIDYKWTDRVDGELHRDLIVSPEVTANPSKKVLIFSNDEAQKLNILLEANKVGVSDELRIKFPSGWQVSPPVIPFTLSRGEQKSFSVEISPPQQASTAEFRFSFKKMKAQSVQRIDYPHIKPQIMFPYAKIKAVKMDIKKTVNNVGYIIGSGDEVAESIEQLGFKVTTFTPDMLAQMDLSVFETIIVGIRAYNTEESMKNGNGILNHFVKSGGNVIVQYNTSRGLKSDQIGPYRFRISRKRVTKEEAKPTFLQPKHPLLNKPNKLSMADFEGWVQERGLYFADQWDEKYETIIAWNDPGEEAQEGSILVANYGEGHFIYTGISFFRQLPAGVPGAYRLLSNMISYGRK